MFVYSFLFVVRPNGGGDAKWFPRTWTLATVPSPIPGTGTRMNNSTMTLIFAMSFAAMTDVLEDMCWRGARFTESACAPRSYGSLESSFVSEGANQMRIAPNGI
jgi:hypothetical protein